MTRKIETGDLHKALSALQDIAKGHSSGSTATTKVESMVSESGSTQLFHTASNSDPGGWAGSSWRGEGWEDMIEANGTDLGAVRRLGKSIARGIMTKLNKGLPLSARETAFVSKGGMNFLDKMKAAKADKAEKAMDKDEDEEKSYAKAMKADMEKAVDEDEDEDEVEKAMDEDEDDHPDVAEDKKLVREMVKPGAMKKAKAEVSKSLLDHAVENPAVQQGFEVAEFLAGWAQVMHKSLQSAEARIADRILTAIARSEAETGEVSKSMAGALASLGEVLAAQQQRLDQIEAGPARAPKSQMTVQKSGVVPSPVDGGGSTLENMNKSQIAERLLDLVKKSEATPQDVLKFDASGILSPDLARKIASR